MLSSSNRNLCVVGDPDQSIYSWRNADVRNLIKFQEDFPDSKTISLSENYRSSSVILSAAKKLIEVNTLRIKNELWTKNKIGDPIVIKEAFNQEDEAAFVINENNIMKISFREKFNFRRGRLNCSLNENGQWKWFGHQFTVQIPK